MIYLWFYDMTPKRTMAMNSPLLVAFAELVCVRSPYLLIFLSLGPESEKKSFWECCNRFRKIHLLKIYTFKLCQTNVKTSRVEKTPHISCNEISLPRNECVLWWWTSVWWVSSSPSFLCPSVSLASNRKPVPLTKDEPLSRPCCSCCQTRLGFIPESVHTELRQCSASVPAWHRVSMNCTVDKACVTFSSCNSEGSPLSFLESTMINHYALLLSKSLGNVE